MKKSGERTRIEQPALYVYAMPNTMEGYLQNGEGHRFTDDVAVCYAGSLEEAVDIFSKLYGKVQGNVREASFNNYGVCICTDY